MSELTIAQIKKISGTVLGFDFGTYKTGIAVGQPITGIATALTTLTAIRNKPNWDKITQLISHWQPSLLIVGLPLDEDGSFQNMTQRASRFGNQLRGRYNITTIWIDERYSSLSAKTIIAEQMNTTIKNSKTTTDAVAAQIIVQSWLDNPDNTITEIMSSNDQ